MCYYIYVAYDSNEVNKACGSGGTADALASGASGGNPVEVQILSTAPFLYSRLFPKDAVVVERQTRHFEGVVNESSYGFESHRPHQLKLQNPIEIAVFQT